ncbi:MAG: ketoacyl-ACP synthase III [Gammaproteobacteria bacterium]
MKIKSCLPEAVLNNQAFAELGWPSEKIMQKTGIRQRHIAGPNETALDLAVAACEALFADGIDKNTIDFVLYCTQSPDQLLPNNVSTLQQRLQLPTHIGSLDFNQGCSGFVYGLSLAKGLLATQQVKKLLLVTSDTYSKYITADDRTNRSVFGDGACATYLTLKDTNALGNFVFGTDGSGASNLCVSNFGLRYPLSADSPKLTMNGPAIFNFTLATIPNAVDRVLTNNQLTLDDIDHVVFHQANGYVLEHLRSKLAIPKEKFHIYIEEVGNTVSSTIPLTLEWLMDNQRLKPGEKILLVGFGIGYSWIATVYTVPAT